MTPRGVGRPFVAGESRTIEAARKGGKRSAADRQVKAAASPLTRGLLGELLTYTTGDWMDRLGLTEPSWLAWRVIGKVLDGEPLTDDEQVTYRALTGRGTVPGDLRELWVIAGRGSGKSSFTAVQALRAACRAYAGRGVPRVLLLAFVKEQAAIAFEYVSAFVHGDRELRKLITRRTRNSLTFAHGVLVQTISSNYRTVRGYSVACSLCDEIAHWWVDDTASNPAEEIVRALRPGLGKVPGSRLLAATTPWTEEGIVYDVHGRHHGNDDSRHILVVRAPTLTLNPSFDAARIASDEAEDPESAASEYGAAWRVAGGTLVRPDVLDAAIEPGVTERNPVPALGEAQYSATVDLSGGAGQDSAALSIQHVERDGGSVPTSYVQDVLREWVPPFDPGTACEDIAKECARFGIATVIGDQFSEGFAAAEFRRHGLAYAVSPRTTAACVLDALAVLNTHRARLLDHAKARRQWLNLRRAYAAGGRPTVLDTRQHDDLAVATARGITVALGLGRPKPKFMFDCR